MPPGAGANGEGTAGANGEGTAGQGGGMSKGGSGGIAGHAGASGGHTGGTAGAPPDAGTTARIDAVYLDGTRINYSQDVIYFFNGDRYARRDTNPRQFEPGTTDIANLSGIPFDSVDAAFMDDTREAFDYDALFFFSGESYVIRNSNTKAFGDTGSLSDFPGMPFDTVDAVYLDKTLNNYSHPVAYFFSGNQYARLNVPEQEFEGGVAPITNFDNIPFETVDAVYMDDTRLNYGFDVVYFIHGDQYARFNAADGEFSDMSTTPLENFAGIPF